MKYLLIFLIITFPVILFAADFSLHGKGGIYVPSESGLQQGNYYQLNVQWKTIYLYGSLMTTERRIAGQRAGDINLWSGGFGMERKLTPHLNIWGQIGYYLPSHKAINGHGSGGAEPSYLYWQKWGRDHNFDVSPFQHFFHKISGNMGGAFGLDLSEEITDHFSLSLNGGYQILKLREQFWARNDNPAYYIETREHLNFSGGLIGFQLEYKF